MKKYQALLLVIAILVIDQITKLWVKTHMMLGEEIPITNWLIINFVENPGMAFGMKLPGVWGKLFLSVFRLIAVTGGTWFLLRCIEKKEHWGFTTCVALILAGAVGNMIDGTFYGVIFTDSYGRYAELFPAAGGYSGWMQGLVVDMVQLKLFHVSVPESFPIWSGQEFDFFPFIFNIADASISIGVFLILIFQNVFFKEEQQPEAVNEVIEQPAV